jgi:hypothetical protein
MRRPKVFNPKAMIKVSGADKLTAQAREASAATAGRARVATSAAARTAAEAASKSVRQIGPPDSRQKRSHPALRWSLLATAALTAAGAAALLVRQRYRAGMAVHTEDAEALVQPTPATGAEPVPATGLEPTMPASSAPVDGPADTGVNGKVSAPG